MPSVDMPFKFLQPLIIQAKQTLFLYALYFSSIPTLLLPSTSLGAEAIPTSAYFGLDTMAPESRWAIRFEQRANQYHQRYDNDGNLSDVSSQFNGVNLNSQVFPALSVFGANASLGTTSLTTKNTNQISILTIGYGLTPDLTIGAIIPYGQSQTKANFSVEGGNIGFNPLFDAGNSISASNFPFAPVGSGISPLGTSGVQEILTNPAFGYRYKPLNTTQQEGFSDPTFGVLWRAYKSSQESLILGLGVRLGVAKKDDPDDLLDAPLGDGSTDLRTRMEYFRELSPHLDLHLLADYNLQTADTAEMRIPTQGQLLATYDSKQTLHRNLGDFYETDVELGYRMANWRFSSTWHRYEKAKDHYRSDIGTDVALLEANTYTKADQYRLSAAWSGIQAWQQGKLPMPVILKLEMQDTFAGKNFVDVYDVYLQMNILL